MGSFWTSGGGTWGQLIGELTKTKRSTRPDGTVQEYKTLAHCLKGNNLWAVHAWEEDGKETQRFICLYLLMRGDGEVGYKPVDESMGPLEVSCPLGYLKMVPEPPNDYGRSWRQRVHAYHAKRAVQTEKGKAYVVIHSQVTYVRVDKKMSQSVRGYCGGLGGVFRVPKKVLVVIPDSARTETVMALAKGIAAEWALDRLPILADALEEGGYDDNDRLAILRQPKHRYGVRMLAAILDDMNILKEG